jgi:hypothetical protein
MAEKQGTLQSNANHKQDTYLHHKNQARPENPSQSHQHVYWDTRTHFEAFLNRVFTKYGRPTPHDLAANNEHMKAP